MQCVRTPSAGQAAATPPEAGPQRVGWEVAGRRPPGSPSRSRAQGGSEMGTLERPSLRGLLHRDSRWAQGPRPAHEHRAMLGLPEPGWETALLWLPCAGTFSGGQPRLVGGGDSRQAGRCHCSSVSRAAPPPGN